jgi:hypothetical protein
MPAKKTIRSAGGFGPSKTFIGTEGSLGETGVDRILKCHINGVEISAMNLDPQVLCALDYGATDEGIAAKNARPDVREPSGIEVTAEPFTKALDQRRNDVLSRGIPMSDARDPLKEVADKYAVAGMRPKFLSQRLMKEDGGAGDYEIVKKANGDPVMVKGMVLGHAPAELVEANLRNCQQRGNQLLKQIGEQHRAENGPDSVLAGQSQR